jgi:amidophosphoribosyltransferase
MSDTLTEKCGLFGVYGHPDAVALTILGLSALQHRGQESAGVAYVVGGPQGRDVECVKVMGTVNDLAARTQSLTSPVVIGHVRYGTSGSRSLGHAQPFLASGIGGRVALGHNGHIVGIDRLRALVSGDGDAGLENDSELLTRRVAMHFTTDIGSAMQSAFRDVTPAYSILVLTADTLAAIRDPLGMRPLSVGRKGTATVISSETCALNAIGATAVRDVDRDEILLVQGDDGPRSLRARDTPREISAHCIFELIYFARADSTVFGHSVAAFRTRLGARLALEAPAPADVVVPVPDSAVYGALGYAQASGLELSLSLFRNDFVGRSFIEPTPGARRTAIRTKLNPIPSLISGQRVILVDDSIVRGNTCAHVVQLLRSAGAREVHVRVTSPQMIASCHFGVDTPHDAELFANGRDVAEMRQLLGADSLQFLSHEGLLTTAGSARGFCDACFTGNYPVDVPHRRASELRDVVSVPPRSSCSLTKECQS